MFATYRIISPINIRKRALQMLVFLIIFILSSMSTNAQNVQSKSFDRMLKKMLKGDVPTLNVDQADSMQKENCGVVFLDTRKKKEYDVSHIKNARWIGFDEFSTEKLKGVEKNATIINYCSVGARSEKITRKMRDAGFTNVYNLYGSIFEWVNAGKEVVDSNDMATERVHTYSRLWGVWLKKGKRVHD